MRRIDVSLPLHRWSPVAKQVRIVGFVCSGCVVAAQLFVEHDRRILARLLRRIYQRGFTDFTREGIFALWAPSPFGVTVSFTSELEVYPGLPRNPYSVLF